MGDKKELWEQIGRLSGLSLNEEEMQRMEDDMEEIDSFLSILTHVPQPEKDQGEENMSTELRGDDPSPASGEKEIRLPFSGQGREEP